MSKLICLKGGLVLCAVFGVSSIAHAAFIEVYADKASAKHGEDISFQISSNADSVSIKVSRTKAVYNFVTIASNITVVTQPVLATQPWRTGAGWSPTHTITVPDDWTPGLYEFRVFESANISNYKRVLIAIRPAVPGSYSKIAVLTNDSTRNAYNPWGGKSNYGYNSAGDRTNVLAYNRPGTLEYAWEDNHFPEWADRVGMPVEYISSLDLHFEAGVLDAYHILVLSGHSEYWSREMRSALEAFLERGGKLISLSGNTMWWIVRFKETEDGVQMISCKGLHNDPECPSDDVDLFTGYWTDIGNPEQRVMGASFRHGGYVDSHHFYTAAMGYGGYFVQDQGHWLWAGTGALGGDQVGKAAGIAGYEADAPPLVTGPLGSLRVDPAATDLPANIQVLGWTPAATPNWEGHGAIIWFPYGQNGGEVFNCGSVDCANGLVSDPQWRKAMLNVFVKFGALSTVLTDYDSDGLDDSNDNCIAFPNPDQLDTAGDGTGDVCDRHCH